MRKVMLASVCALALALSGCGDEATGPASNSGGSVGGGGGGSAGGGGASSTVTIDMRNIAFIAPGGGDDVTITLGDTIRWVNRENASHTVRSSAVPPGGAELDSGLLRNGDVFVFVPQVRGEWTYLCEVHPTIMRGATITVQ